TFRPASACRCASRASSPITTRPRRTGSRRASARAPRTRSRAATAAATDPTPPRDRPRRARIRADSRGTVAAMTTIRAARTYDAPAIAALGGQLGYVASRQQIATRLAGIESERSSRVIVAEDASGAVVGWLHVAARTQLTEDACAEILGL